MSSTSFSIKDDLKVAYWSEPDDLFMLGFSTLDGADVLGNSAKSWISLSDYVTSVEIDNGTQVEQGVLNYPKAGNCSVSMLGDELSSFVNRSLRAGTFVSVGLRPTDATADMYNYVTNPKPSTFTGSNTLWYVYARGAGYASTSSIIDGYWVDQVTSAGANTTYTWSVGSQSNPTLEGIPVLPSATYTASVYVTSSINDYRSLSIKWWSGAGAYLGSSSSTTVQLVAGVESRHSITAVAPSGASYAALQLDTNGSSVIRTAGSYLKLRKAFMDYGSC